MRSSTADWPLPTLSLIIISTNTLSCMWNVTNQGLASSKFLWYPLIQVGLLVELCFLTSPRSLVPSSLRGLEKEQLQDVDMRLMWALLLLSLAQVHHWIYDRKSTTWVKNKKGIRFNRLFIFLTDHLASCMLPNGSLLKSNHREYFLLSTGRHSHSQ